MGALGDCAAAGAVGEVERLAEKWLRLGWLALAAKSCSEIGESPREFELRGSVLEGGDGISAELQAAGGGVAETGGALRHADCPGSTPASGELQLLVGELLGFFVAAERVQRPRGRGAPRDLRGVGSVPRVGEFADREQLIDGVMVVMQRGVDAGASVAEHRLGPASREVAVKAAVGELAHRELGLCPFHQRVDQGHERELRPGRPAG